MIENSADAISLYARDGSILYASPGIARILGYDPEELTGRDVFERIRDLVHPEDRDRVAARLAEAFARPGVSIAVDARVRHRDGSWRFLEGAFRNLLDDPDVGAVVTNYRDVTDRKRAEETLRESETRKRAILDAALDAVITIDASGEILEFNPAAEVLFGYSQSEAIGRQMSDLVIPPDWRERHRRGFQRYLETGEAHLLGRRLEMPAMRKDGRLFPAELTINRVAAEGESLFTGYLRDISDRKKAEEARARLAAIVESSDDAIVSTTPQGTILSWNRGAEQMYGYSAPQLLGRPISVLEPRERAGELASLLRTGDATQGVQRYETVRLRKNGTLVDVAVTLSPTRDAAGELTGFASIARDITDRKRAERALRESEAFLEKAQEVAHIGSWISGLNEDQTLVWSKETCRIFGVPESEFDRTIESFFSRVHPDDVDAVKQAVAEAIARDEPYEIEHRIFRPDGTMRWVYERADILRDAEGRPFRMIGSVQDVTEVRQLQEQLLQSQKIEAVGLLAGGIAHDFNNVLTAILGYCDLIKGRLTQDDPLSADFEEIRRAGERAAALTHQLLAFSRRQMLEPRVLDINAVVSHIGEMLRRLIGEDVELALSLDPSIGRIRADPGQIEQVITNLAVNARDAMPQGGRLEIETSNASLDARYASQHPGALPGPYVRLAVSDTGVGMDAATRSRIFEPFFTTKTRDKGTGLGLATVYGIVKQSGGYIWVNSEPRRGTTLEVYLPRVEDTVDAAEAPPQEASPSGSETILLVEDEPPVRKLARTILERLGYEVLETDRGEEALEIARTHPAPIHLVLTDVVMPEMGGTELASRLRTVRPGARILFMSGYTDDAVARDKLLEAGTSFLQKPFTPAALARKVRDALSRRR